MWIQFTETILIAQAPQPSSGDMIVQMLVPFGLIFLVFYFLMWRPQNKQRQNHQTYLSNLQSNDEIVTVGGIIGTIKSIDDKVVTIEVSKGNKMKILKSRIKGSKASVLQGDKKPEEPKKEES